MSPTALITGASSGIGLELAKLFARNRYRLVLVARNRPALETIAAGFQSQFGTDVQVVAADLARPESPAQIVDALAGAPVEVLVNNAGFATHGLFAATDLRTQLDLVQVNITALTELTGRLLPPMLAAGRGKILNLASTAAFAAGPLMAVYYASKAYVLSFSEALANEVAGSGITVSVLAPGPTRTDFAARAGVQNARLFRLGGMDAAAVAQAGYEGLMQGKTLIIPGLSNKLLVQSSRIGPRKLNARVVRALNTGHSH